MSEHSQQAMVIQWAKRHEGKWPELRWIHSSLNGIFIPGPRKMAYKIMNHMKAEGQKNGVPDLFLPVARRGFHGLFIEMKRDDKQAPRPEQIEFMQFAEEQGYRDQVCYGYQDAVNELEWYLGKEHE